MSSYTYEELFKTDRGVNMEQPEATFISFRGLWNEDEVGSGLKDWIQTCNWLGLTSHYMWQTQVENEHYSTVSGLIQLVIIISRMLY